MREPHFDGLRAYADGAARQPDFAVIQQRAVRVRRRRVIASSTAAAVVALLATSVGYAAAGGQRAAVPPPPSSTSVEPEAGWPRITGVTATGSADLYAVYERCRACGPELYASGDAGATWQRRSVPPAPDSAGPHPTMELLSLGPDALVWRYLRVVTLRELEKEGILFSGSSPASPTAPAHEAASPPTTGLLWTTIDGGKTWRQTVVDPTPVAAVPPGTRPVDCHLLRQPSPCRIYAVDPTSGRFAPLAHQPSGITFEQPGARMFRAGTWVTGLDPTTGKPAVASSSDAGRTWHTHVFADGVPAVEDNGTISGRYLPAVAAGMGKTAYATVYRGQGLRDSYRTTDGGVTWRPVPGGALAEVNDAGMVTADGAHVVQSGQEFLASRDGGPYQRATLPGYPAAHLAPAQQRAAGRYLEFTDSHLYSSDDGWTWRRVDVP